MMQRITEILKQHDVNMSRKQKIVRLRTMQWWCIVDAR